MPAPPSHRTGVLAIVLASYLMIVLDISIVITALPKIQQGLDFTAGTAMLAVALALVLALIVRRARPRNRASQAVAATS